VQQIDHIERRAFAEDAEQPALRQRIAKLAHHRLVVCGARGQLAERLGNLSQLVCVHVAAPFAMRCLRYRISVGLEDGFSAMITAIVTLPLAQARGFSALSRRATCGVSARTTARMASQASPR